MNDHKHIGEKWEGRKAPIDKDVLWNKISLDEKFPKKEKKVLNKKRRLIFIFVSLLFLVSLGTILNSEYFTDSQLNQISDALNSSSEKKQIKRKKDSVDYFAGDQITDNQKNNSNTNYKENNKSYSNFGTATQRDNSNYSNENLITNPDNTKNDNDDLKFKKNVEFKSQSMASNTNSNKSFVVKESSNSIGFNSKNNHKTKSHNTFSESEEKSEFIKMGDKDIQDSKAFDVKQKSNQSTSDQLETKLISGFNPELSISKLNTLGLFLLEPKRFNYMLPPKVVKINNDKINNWYLSIMAGIGFDTHSISNNLSEPSEAFSQWNQNTKPNQSRYYNISLSKKMGKGFNFSLEFEIQNTYQIFNKYVETKNEIIRNDDPSSGFYSQIIEGLSYSLNHKYSLYNFNFLIEKEFSLGNLSVSPGIGSSYNLISSVIGEVYDDGQTKYSIADFDSYKNRANLISFVSLKIQYPVDDNFDVFVSTRYYKGRTLTVVGKEFNHSFDSFSLNTGLSYGF